MRFYETNPLVKELVVNELGDWGVNSVKPNWENNSGRDETYAQPGSGLLGP